MSGTPRLKVVIPGEPAEMVLDLDEAQDALFGRNANLLVLVGERTVASYFELLRLANQDDYKNREFIEVIALPMIDGG